MTFISNPRRDASATIAGFVFQVNVTILRWLELRDDEHLEIECGEDIDTVQDGSNGGRFAETRLLDRENGAQEFQLVAQRNAFQSRGAKRVAKHVGQLRGGLFGRARIDRDQRGDRIERVEQEVRMDLCSIRSPR